MVSNIFFYVHPYLERWSHLTHIFQMVQPPTRDPYVFFSPAFVYLIHPDQKPCFKHGRGVKIHTVKSKSPRISYTVRKIMEHPQKITENQQENPNKSPNITNKFRKKKNHQTHPKSSRFFWWFLGFFLRLQVTGARSSYLLTLSTPTAPDPKALWKSPETTVLLKEFVEKIYIGTMGTHVAFIFRPYI